jgi:TnpA family transposase
MYGRLFKTRHILSYIDVDEACRRDIKGIRNLQEGRHSLGWKICHGKKGELYHRYERGLENQLGALGLVLNCATLWTTVYWTLPSASSGTRRDLSLQTRLSASRSSASRASAESQIDWFQRQLLL